MTDDLDPLDDYLTAFATPSPTVVTGMHVGRSWRGNLLERDCPCEKAPCGLIKSESAVACPEHSVVAMKTIRQAHRAEACPGRRPEDGER